jgi:hypothetical protein
MDALSRKTRQNFRHPVKLNEYNDLGGRVYSFDKFIPGGE